MNDVPHVEDANQDDYSLKYDRSPVDARLFASPNGDGIEAVWSPSVHKGGPGAKLNQDRQRDRRNDELYSHCLALYR
jgi:hypothetical protein